MSIQDNDLQAYAVRRTKNAIEQMGVSTETMSFDPTVKGGDRNNIVVEATDNGFSGRFQVDVTDTSSRVREIL